MSMYEVKLDLKRRCVEIMLRGYWDEKVMDAYEREETAAFEALDRLGPPTFCLSDVSELPPQAKEIVERHVKRIQSPLTKMPSRMATVASSAIVKLQSERVVPTDRTERKTFASREEAEAWLFDVAN
ncbi:MAG TPA: hypothetical protein VJ859_13600 [Allosphingosinicella sp.]|nr:hypothetical protein [Allosphingosinicella sp.]